MFSVFGGLSTSSTWHAARLQFCNSLVTNAADFLSAKELPLVVDRLLAGRRRLAGIAQKESADSAFCLNQKRLVRL